MILADDFDRRLVPRDVERNSLTGADGPVVELVRAPVVIINWRKIEMAYLPSRIVDDGDRRLRICAGGQGHCDHGSKYGDQHREANDVS